MKIAKLTTYRVPPRWMLLKIETDEGVFGWGEPVIEARARTVETAVRAMAPFLIGQGPARLNDLWQTMCRADFYRGGRDPDQVGGNGLFESVRRPWRPAGSRGGGPARRAIPCGAFQVRVRAVPASGGRGATDVRAVAPAGN